MKVKDLERTANIAWSPENVNPIYLAAGTAGQQLDATFSTNATLEIFALNLAEPGMEMDVKVNVASDNRFHKVVWGAQGGEGLGTIVGGCDGGIMQIYNAGKLFKGEPAVVSKPDKHSGPVHSLDFNPFQSNLLATGAAESEIYIWDMNNTNTPMTPGSKSQPFEDVLSIQWNRQVQHILASTFSSKCVVWDLRKNEPIIKLTDTVSRIRWKEVAWHPEVATQLCLASEEDQAPIIQLWDLRFATSPLKTLENHQRGVLSIAWCKQDPDLLISSGKDNRIVCWNPNSNNPGGEILSEVARTNQWNFDISWCPKNPALIATPGFDGHVSIYSLMGGKAQQIQTSNKIADSFPGMEGYVQAPVAQQNVAPVSVDLNKPPRWLKKPVGAKFGFGGKLITFEHDKTEIAQAQQNIQPGQTVPHIPRTVHISQVVTESELVVKSTELEQALEYGNFIEYCKNKADSLSDQHKRYIWYFLKANFEQNPRAELLNLLGYKIEDVNSKLASFVDLQKKPDVNEQFSNVNRCDYSYGDYVFLRRLRTVYSIEDYNNLLQDHSFGDITQSQPEESARPVSPYKIKTGDDTEGLIVQALLLNNVEAAVELCLKAKRFADAIIISMTGGSELIARTQTKYLQQSEGYVSMLISALVTEDWASVINNCDINSWKEALAAALTHSSDEDLPALCELMGSRLELEAKGNQKLHQDAQLCYICAGSFDKLVQSWSTKAKNSNEDLQELVELVTFLQKSVERQGRNAEIGGHLAKLLSNYAFILASQGSLSVALNYLGNSQDAAVTELRERLFVALGHKSAYGQQVQTRSRQNTNRSSISGYTSQFSQPQTNAYKQFNAGLLNAPQQRAQPWEQPQQQTNAGGYMQQPPKTFSPAPAMSHTGPPPISQPPRPGSVGSGHGGSGLPKNKYVLDPSVQSGPYGMRNQFSANPLAPQMQNFQSNAISNPPGNPYAPNNQMPASNFPPSSVPYAPQPAAVPFTPNNPPMMPSAGFGAQQPLNPIPPMTPMNPTQLIPQSPVVQPPPLTEMGLSAMNILPPNAAHGWNDPPAFNKPGKMPHPKADVAPQNPITHPIFGSAAPTNMPSNGYPDQNQQPFNPYSVPPQNNTPHMYQHQQHQQPPQAGGFNQGFNSGAPSSFNTQAVTNQNFNTQPMAQDVNRNVPQQQQQRQQGRVEQPAPVPKLPIPEEHIHMQTVFDELRKQCSCSANNPQTKRKIDDVSRKLEMLYDLLREHKLSQNTLSSLHQMVQLVQNGDYASGLNLHTQLVSGPDFAQIASFMPGLKVLLQCALQLQVYLR